ncbi:hypothetical protein [Streptomyces sp. NPDC058092]|uniref:hypothetical protein n=1 Tax=Streptomyces sp. NPDC058092 TaxID=3346336 RepID=UPI0036EB8D55
MSTRETLLARITVALADVPATETSDSVPVPRDYRSSHAGNDPAALFVERVADYQATVIRTAEEGGRRPVSHP